MGLSEGQFKAQLVKIADAEKLPRGSRARKRFFDFAVKRFGKVEYPDFHYIGTWAHRFYNGSEYTHADGDFTKTLQSIDGKDYGMQGFKNVGGFTYRLEEVCTSSRCADRFKQAHLKKGKNVYVYYFKCPAEVQWGIYVR